LFIYLFICDGGRKGIQTKLIPCAGNVQGPIHILIACPSPLTRNSTTLNSDLNSEVYLLTYLLTYSHWYHWYHMSHWWRTQRWTSLRLQVKWYSNSFICIMLV